MVTEAADLALGGRAACEDAGRVLGAANRALPRPAAPHLALWQATTTLREHRGDGHLAALAVHGVGPVASHVLKVAAGESPGPRPPARRRVPDAAWAAEVAAARRPGASCRVPTTSPALTDDGEALHAAVEHATDHAAAGPWEALGPGATARLAALLAPITAAARSVVPPLNPARRMVVRRWPGWRHVDLRRHFVAARAPTGERRRPRAGARNVPLLHGVRARRPDRYSAASLSSCWTRAEAWLLTPDFFPTLFGNIGLIALYAVIGAVLMYAGYFAIDLTTPGDLRGLVREGRPNAVVVSASGLVSMALIVVVAIYISGGGPRRRRDQHAGLRAWWGSSPRCSSCAGSRRCRGWTWAPA